MRRQALLLADSLVVVALVRTTALGPLTLKGFTQPMPAFVVEELVPAA